MQLFGGVGHPTATTRKSRTGETGATRAAPNMAQDHQAKHKCSTVGERDQGRERGGAFQGVGQADVGEDQKD